MSNVRLHLRMDQIIEDAQSNKQVIDLSGEGNHATVHGGVKTVTDDTFGECLEFNGLDTYLELSAPPFNNHTEFTISRWIRPAALNTGSFQGLLGKEGNPQSPGLWIHRAEEALHYYSHSNTNPPKIISGHLQHFFKMDQEWVHICWVKEGGAYRFYKNGVLFDTQTRSAPEHFHYRDEGYHIGKVGNVHFKGRMAGVRIYDETLSPEEIENVIETDLHPPSTDLVLHLKLDETDDSGNFFDSSDHDQPVTTLATASSAVVKDDKEFVHATYFTGTNGAIRVPNTTTLNIKGNSFTVEAWCKIAPALDRLAPDIAMDLPILTTEGTPAFELLLRKEAHDNGFYPYVSFGVDGEALVPDKTVPLQTDEWYHLALVYDQALQTQTLYLRGQAIATATGRAPLSAEGRLQVGQGGSHFFHSVLSNIRVYSGALTKTAIEHDMYQDLPPYAFHKLYPVDFSFQDPDKHDALYIESKPTGKVYTLEITNTAKEVIYLRDLSAAAVGPDHYHFALHFRPGTLTAASVDTTTGTGIALTPESAVNWALSIPHANENKRNKEGDTLYFSWNPQTVSGLKGMAPDEKIQLQLANLAIDGDLGARATRVELRTDHLYYRHDSEFDLKVTREKHLNIINHRGEQYIPLHVGIMGSDTVLNNGEADQLKLRVVNTSQKDTITFRQADPATGAVPREQPSDRCLRTSPPPPNNGSSRSSGVNRRNRNNEHDNGGGNCNNTCSTSNASSNNTGADNNA